MSFEAGKYDDLCSHIMKEAEAEAALVIVIKGNKGHGFSAHIPQYLLHYIPYMLEGIAKTIKDDIDKDIHKIHEALKEILKSIQDADIKP